jgi:hypothetical protein
MLVPFSAIKIGFTQVVVREMEPLFQLYERPAPSVRIVVQYALSVAAKYFDFMEKELVWLPSGHFNPVSGRGILSAFSGPTAKIWTGCRAR